MYTLNVARAAIRERSLGMSLILDTIGARKMARGSGRHYEVGLLIFSLYGPCVLIIT